MTYLNESIVDALYYDAKENQITITVQTEDTTVKKYLNDLMNDSLLIHF